MRKREAVFPHTGKVYVGMCVLFFLDVVLGFFSPIYQHITSLFPGGFFFLVQSLSPLHAILAAILFGASKDALYVGSFGMIMVSYIAGVAMVAWVSREINVEKIFARIIIAWLGLFVYEVCAALQMIIYVGDVSYVYLFLWEWVYNALFAVCVAGLGTILRMR